MTCRCECKCDNLLTVIDGPTRCRQCFLGAHAKAKLSDVDQNALATISQRVHDATCGKVPGYEHADLFGHHEEVAEAILRILKGQPRWQ